MIGQFITAAFAVPLLFDVSQVSVCRYARSGLDERCSTRSSIVIGPGSHRLIDALAAKGGRGRDT